MQANEIHEANPQASGSGQEPHSEFQLSDKLRARLENLAQWRLDPSLIEFPGGASEFRGGFATVSQAHLASTPDRQTSKVVAVKKLKVENDADVERVLGLALRESEFVVGLSHPNIVRLEGFVEDASRHMIWLVFSWEENGNLRDFLGSGEWEIPERISLIRDVAEGVKYLHSRTPPIYHGDLKSLNLLVNPEFRAVITDFGSARRLEAKDLDKDARKREPQPRPEQATGEESMTLQAVYSASTNTITLTGDKYTLRWAAPELLRDELPSLACDIWALGWIAYEVMTNTIPFHDVKRDVAVVNRVIQGNLPSITNHARMSLIQALCSLMAQCWSISPEKRPTAADCVKLIYWMGKATMPAHRTASPRHRIFTQPPRTPAEKLTLYGILLKCIGGQAEYSKAAGFYSEALQLYTDIGDHRWRAYALASLAEVHRTLGEYTKASAFYSEARQIYADIGHQSGRAHSLWGLAEIHRLRGEYGEAIKLLSEGLQIQTDEGFSLGRADVLWSIGEVHRYRREYSEAIKFHSESLQICTEMGHRSGQAQALWGLAEVHRSREECDDAATLYSKALHISTDIGSKRWRAEALLGLAKTHDRQGRRGEAISCYTEASEAWREVGFSQRAADALEMAANLRTEETA